MNIFEQAARQAFRFESPKGFLTVEDLWNLPLTQRNSLTCRITGSFTRNITITF